MYGSGRIERFYSVSSENRFFLSFFYSDEFISNDDRFSFRGEYKWVYLLGKDRGSLGKIGKEQSGDDGDKSSHNERQRVFLEKSIGSFGRILHKKL